MISRHWKGTVRQGRAEDYVHHLRRDTFPSLAALRGFVRASILRRPVEGGVEFLVITVWESLDAIRAFAGANPEEAVVPPAAQALLLHYDRRVTHYEVEDIFSPAETTIPGGGQRIT